MNLFSFLESSRYGTASQRVFEKGFEPVLEFNGIYFSKSSRYGLNIAKTLSRKVFELVSAWCLNLKDLFH